MEGEEGICGNERGLIKTAGFCSFNEIQELKEFSMLMLLSRPSLRLPQSFTVTVPC